MDFGWFFEMPGLFITGGVVLIIIALIVFLIGSKKGNKEKAQENASVVEPIQEIGTINGEVATALNTNTPQESVTVEPVTPAPQEPVTIEPVTPTPVEPVTIEPVIPTPVEPVTVEPVVPSENTTSEEKKPGVEEI